MDINEYHWTEWKDHRPSLTPITHDPRLTDEEKARLQAEWNDCHKQALQPPLKPASDKRLAELDTALVAYAQLLYRNGSSTHSRTYTADLSLYVRTFEGWRALKTLQSWHHSEYLACKAEEQDF